MLKDMAFCLLLESMEINMVKNCEIDAKSGIDAAKTASKRIVQKTAEATGDFIGNKIADKITSVGKSKEKKPERKTRRNIHCTRKKTTNY